MGNIGFIHKKEKDFSTIPWNSVITGNKDYLIYNDEVEIVNILSLKTNRNIKIDSHSSIIKMHIKYANIFVLAEGGTAKLYEINKDNFICEEKSKIGGYSNQIKLIEFSKNDDKIFATYSSDMSFRIWKLNHAFCLCNILLINEIRKFQFYKDYIFYFDKKNGNIVRYDYKKYKEDKYDYIKRKEFFVLNEDNIVVIKDGNILVKYSGNKQQEVSIIQGATIEMFYDEKLSYLYVFTSSTIYVIDMKKITNELYSFFPKLSANSNYNLMFPGNGFLEKCVPHICGIENLKWSANVVEPKENLFHPKYLDNPEINDMLNENCKKYLSLKKKEVADNFDKNKDYDYNQLIMNIIKDNTNKELIIKYLKYLENDGGMINNSKTESFKNEYGRYKIMYGNEELKNNQFKGKNSSEQDNFMILLNEISNLDFNDLDNFKKKINKNFENSTIFNQPVDFSNKELYWYRNTFVIYSSLKMIFDEKENMDKLINLMKSNIDIIIKRNIFKKDFILNNKELLTSVIALIALPQPTYIIEYNLNLIESADEKYNFDEEIKKNDIFSYSDNTKDNIFYFYKNKDDKNNENNKNDNNIINNSQNNDSKEIVKIEPSSCVSNIILNVVHNLELEKIELNNYNEMKNSFNEIIDFEKMYNFLAKVISSRVFKEAFAILYPNYYKYPFETKDDALKFLKQYYKFIPFKSLRSGAFTEKFSLEIYYPLKKRQMYIPYIDIKYKIIVKKILYRGNFVVTSTHEINHEFYNILLKHLNGTIPILTP